MKREPIDVQVPTLELRYTSQRSRIIDAMTTLLQVDRATYACSCGEWVPLCRLYFCRHCVQLRCKDCVSHEIDSIFCSNCLENMPTAEARVKQNRCSNCSECPSCGNTLSFRATSLAAAPTPGPDGEKAVGTPKKMYYLACNLCRWSTRDAGLPDQAQANNWPVAKNTDEEKLNAIVNNFRQMAAAEKSERERKKFSKRRFHGGLYADKYGLQALMTRRRLGMPLNEKEQPTMEDVAIEPTEEVDELPESIFNDKVNLDTITTSDQRLRQTLSQPTTVAELLPLKNPLSVRRSLRCKECDHNLCKGEYNASSVKFKIQLFGMLHVPEVRMAKEPALVPGKSCMVELTLTNLTQALVHVVLLPDIEAEESGGDFVKADIPVAELSIPMRDETTDLDDSADLSSQFQDDPEIVTFRKKHKLGIRFPIAVPDNGAKNFKLRFTLKYDYVNTITAGTGETREPQILWLQQKVLLHLNKH